VSKVDNPTDSPAVSSWLRGVATGTGQKYRHYINKFFAFSKLSPGQLLSLAQRDKVAAKEKIVEFYREYVGNGYATNTCCNALVSIRSFLSYNEIRFGRFPVNLRNETQYESRRIFTRPEIFRMLVGAGTPRDKALISFVVQSAQRVGVVTRMRYGHVRRQIEDSISPVVIDVDPNISKNRVRHSFAIGQECVDFIKIMMAKREQAGEAIDDESCLFRSNSLGYSKVGDKTVYRGKAHQKDKGKALNTVSIGIIMRNAAASGGVPLTIVVPNSPFRQWKRYELHPHAFRRWWKYMMRRGGVNDAVFLDFILGHRAPYQGAYDTFDHDYIRQEYAKAEPQLTFLRNRSDLVQGRQETNSQRIVDEPEAAALFSEGWRFVTTLPSGRLVVQRDPSPRAMIV
jgi:integrase